MFNLKKKTKAGLITMVYETIVLAGIFAFVVGFWIGIITG